MCVPDCVPVVVTKVAAIALARVVDRLKVLALILVIQYRVVVEPPVGNAPVVVNETIS